MVSASCPGAGINVDGGRTLCPPEKDNLQPPTGDGLPAADERRDRLPEFCPDADEADVERLDNERDRPSKPALRA